MTDRRRVAFVTGAGSGIGRATAEAFAASGYGVALVDRDADLGRQTEQELRKLGDCRFVACDVTEESDAKSLPRNRAAVCSMVSARTAARAS